MKTDVNGCSTCLAGQENYEEFERENNHGVLRHWVEYEFRSPLTGNLFTCVYGTLELCRSHRDEFLLLEKKRESKAEHAFNANHPELNP
jgi:hypothetical protein